MSNARLSPLFNWRGMVASEDGPESATTRHVLLTLSLYMSQKGDSCFPSLSTLASDTGLDKSTVSKHLKTAHKSDWIDKRPKYDDDGMRKGTEYFTTTPPSVDDDQPPVDREQHPVDDDQPNTSSNTETNTRPREDGLPPHAPAMDQVVKYGTGSAGLTEEQSKQFFRHYAAVDFLDGQGRKLNWKWKIGNWKAQEHKYSGDGAPSSEEKSKELI